MTGSEEKVVGLTAQDVKDKAKREGKILTSPIRFNRAELYHYAWAVEKVDPDGND